MFNIAIGDDKQAQKGFQLARRKLEMMQRDIQEYDLVDLFTGITAETDTFFDLLETGEAKLDEARQNLKYEEFYELTQESFNLLQAIKHNQTYQNYCMFVVEERKENLEKIIEIRVKEELSKRLTNTTASLKDKLEEDFESERERYRSKIKKLKSKNKELKGMLREANTKLQKYEEQENRLLEEQKIAEQEAKSLESKAIPNWVFKQLMSKANLIHDYDEKCLMIDFTTQEGRNLFNSIFNLKDSAQPRLPALKDFNLDKIESLQNTNPGPPPFGK
jgi:chromosome segregation ATPase